MREIAASGRPSRVIQAAYESKQIEMENWSLNSLQQRLMAGAFGVPFMPTRSVLGAVSLRIMRLFLKPWKIRSDPGRKVGLVRALLPDISFVHGCVADSEGNTSCKLLTARICGAPWRAKAGFITVEKIVPSEFIKKYAALVKIPSYAVNAVIYAPLGSIPTHSQIPE